MKNTGGGLETRSKIIKVLTTKGSASVSEIAHAFPRCERTIRRHLRNMEDRGIAVKVRGGRPFIWSLSGGGQRSLEESMSA